MGGMEKSTESTSVDTPNRPEQPSEEGIVVTPIKDDYSQGLENQMLRLLKDILKEIKITNVHLECMTGDKVTETDIEF